MLRTICLGWVPLLVSTWTSLTSPSGVTTTRADSTPVNVVMRFSTRFIPQGSGCPGGPGGPNGTGSCGLDVTAAPVPTVRRGYGPVWIAHLQPERFHCHAHLVCNDARAICASAYKDYDKFVAAIASRNV